MVSDTEGGRAVDGRYTGVGRGRSLTLRGAGLWMVGTRGWVGGGL